jgi:hypothetical protein
VTTWKAYYRLNYFLEFLALVHGSFSLSMSSFSCRNPDATGVNTA